MRHKELAVGTMPARAAIAFAGGLVLLLAFVMPTASQAARRPGRNAKEKVVIVKDTDRPFLGVKMQELTDELIKGKELKVKSGILITEVVDGSPAEKAGLREGDVITEFDGKAVKSPEDLQDLVADAKVGDAVKVKVVRDNKPKTFDVTLGEWDHDAMAYTMPHMNFRGDLPDFFSPRRLGVRVSELDQDLAPYFGVKEGEGVLVLGVDDESTAEALGIKSGDVIVQVEGKDVHTARDVRDALDGVNEGDKVSVKVIRSKKTMELAGELKESNFAWFGRGPQGAPGIEAYRDAVRRSQPDRELRKELDQLREEIDNLRKEIEKNAKDGSKERT
jgi:S1-C subfamily serine protease